MPSTAPTNQPHGSGIPTTSPHSQLFAAGSPAAGVLSGQGQLQAHGPPTAQTNTRIVSQQYGLSPFGASGGDTAGQTAGLGIAPAAAQQQQPSPPPFLHGQGGGLTSTQPPAQGGVLQSQGQLGQNYSAAAPPAQPLSTIPPEMIYPQPGAAASSYFPASRGNTPKPAGPAVPSFPPPSQPAVPTPAVLNPPAQPTTVAYTPPTPSKAPQAAASSVALNYGIVGQLAAAATAQGPGAGTPPSQSVSPFSAFGSPSTAASSVLLTPPPTELPQPSAVELPGVSMTRYESMAPAELDAGTLGRGYTSAELPGAAGGKKPSGDPSESIFVGQDTMPAW